MGNKEKDNNQITSTPVKKKLDTDVIKNQIEEKVDYHNKLAEKEKELLGQLNQVRTAIAECRGSIVAYQDLIQDVPSVNGEA